MNPSRVFDLITAGFPEASLGNAGIETVEVTSVRRHASAPTDPVNHYFGPIITDKTRKKSMFSQSMTSVYSSAVPWEKAYRYCPHSMTSVYSSALPWEKASSDVESFKRAASVPCTQAERLERTSSTSITSLVAPSHCKPEPGDDFGEDALDMEWDPDFRRPLMPRAVASMNINNKSLRFVSDPRRFWKSYAREKMNAW